MFSVEFAIGRHSNSKSMASATQIERLSRFETCDRGGDVIHTVIDAKTGSGRGRWGRLMAVLGLASWTTGEA